MTLFVDVTQKDILNGLRGCRWHCPVALALQRVWDCTAHVGNTVAWRDDLPYNKRVPLPNEVKDFVKNFDRYGIPGVGPIKFTLEVPDDIAK